MTGDTLTAEIACVKREIALRERVYPKWVEAGRMKPDAASREIETMKGVLRRLLAVEINGAEEQP